ncbi:MAG: hypothetical protein J7K36_06570 [Archaeoglobaceae archaeon]|nr:hypothetical protein [Archaeoglobaceae archaeon]
MKNLFLVSGEKVTLYTEFGKVKGRVEGVEAIPLMPITITSLDYFRQITGVDGYNTIVVDADNSKIDEIAEKIRGIEM